MITIINIFTSILAVCSIGLDKTESYVLSNRNEAGGHDLFASVSQLEILWENEQEIIDIMERIARKWKYPPKVFKLYVNRNEIQI